ncbi:GDP-L-fucose synthase [Acidobacteria bacterium AH-259-G07]|nr:GDP-L-fucose synthase [Acidobacteria bacterium AH-259-G07]
MATDIVTRFWEGKKVVVTGGAGFLGSFVLEKLQALGCGEVFVPRSCDYDLIRREASARLYKDSKPDILIHLAAEVGGIGANRKRPGRFFYANMAMGLNLIEEGRKYGRLVKFVQVGTVCSYPKFAPIPFREEDLWSGYPEETNAPYGVAKKALLVMLQSYWAEYHFPGIYLLPVNLYGPRDHFELESSHVIPALIRKFVEASERGLREVVVWGSGEPTREFLYVEDAAEGILLATERYQDLEPVNLGTGQETRIRDLADLIARLCNYRGSILWDHSQPDGQPRRRLDTSKADEQFGFAATTPFEDGLRRTIAWFENSRIFSS